MKRFLSTIFLLTASVTAFAQSHWGDYYKGHQFYHSAFIVIERDGERDPGNLELGAFVNGELRGLGEHVERGIYSMMVYGEANEMGQPITFKVFDNVTNTEYNCIQPEDLRLDYDISCTGLPSSPYVLKTVNDKNISDIDLSGYLDRDVMDLLNSKIASNEMLTSLDLTMVEKIGKKLELANPNALVLVSEGTELANQIGEDNNVIVGDECQHLSLCDNYSFAAPCDFTAVEAEYTTEVSSSMKYKTLVLPFDAPLPEGYKAYGATEKRGGSIVLTEDAGIIADQPAIVSGQGGELKITSSDVEITTTTSPETQRALLHGTYTRTTAPAGSYVLQNQGSGAQYFLVAEGKEPGVPPFRTYLSTEGGSEAKSLSIIIEDSVTGIMDIISGNDIVIGSKAIHDLQGRRVVNPTRGVYVVNGRKMVISGK